MTHLVCIISDQAVPNLLFIRQFAQPDSEFFFVSSKEMEEKNSTKNLIASLRLNPAKCHTIVIDANEALKIFDQLKSFPFSKNSQYLVNVTGGNKLMSQMVFQHFLDFKSKMYYAPIDSKDYQQLYPEIKSIPKNTEVKTSLQDYLKAYGFVIQSSLNYYEENPSPQTLMDKILKTKHPGKVKEISEALDDENSKESKSYLSGEWFELYCYNFFKTAFQLRENQIACSVKIKRFDSESLQENDNEFDLMFVHQNDLYVMECKVYKADKIRAEKFTSPMYKLASLSQSKNFGLKSKKYLAVLCNMPKDPKAISQIENAVQTLGISKILDIEAFATYTGRDILRVDQQFKIEQLLKKFSK